MSNQELLGHIKECIAQCNTTERDGRDIHLDFEIFIDTLVDIFNFVENDNVERKEDEFATIEVDMNMWWVCQDYIYAILDKLKKGNSIAEFSYNENNNSCFIDR